MVLAAGSAVKTGDGDCGRGIAGRLKALFTSMTENMVTDRKRLPDPEKCRSRWGILSIYRIA
jgi:hypothetical protein